MICSKNELIAARRRCALVNLCIKNDWFTCGGVSSYNKMLNESTEGTPEEIAAMIYVCSDEDISYDDVREQVKAVFNEYMYE